MDDSVRSALEAKVRGNDALYGELIEEIRTCLDLAQVLRLFSALSENASLLAKHHDAFSELLGMLFQFDWGQGDETIARGFEGILSSLVSANVGFLEPAFQLLAKNLIPAPLDDEDDEEGETGGEQVDGAEGKASNKESTDEPSTSAEQADAVMDAKCKHLHRAFRSLLRLAPLGCTTLLPVIIQHFPRKFSDARTHKRYVKEILKIATYVPVIRDKLLAVVVEKLVLMDVEIRLDELDIADDDEDDEDDVEANGDGANGESSEVNGLDTEGVFEMDGDEVQPPPPPPKETRAVLSKHVKRVRELAESLDGIMLRLMEYCDMECDRGKRHGKMLFELVLNLFDRYVLCTRQAKFVQFLVFHLCRRRSEFVDTFVERLLRHALSDKSPSSKRVVAANYLGSFLARATYVRKDSLQSALVHMTKWLQMYSAELDKMCDAIAARTRQSDGFIHNDGDVDDPDFEVEPPAHRWHCDPREHTHYYAVCLAVWYPVLFKEKQVDDEFLRSLPWRDIASSRLSPLIYVAPDVVDEFIRFAHEKQLVLVHPQRVGADDLLNQASGETTMSSTSSAGTDDEVADHDAVAPVWDSVAASHSDQLRDNILKSRAERARLEGTDAAFELEVSYPFDPYMLKASSESINKHYQHWISRDPRSELNDDAASVSASEESGDESSIGEEEEFSQAHLDKVLLQTNATRLPPAIKIPSIRRAAHMLGALGGVGSFDSTSGYQQQRCVSPPSSPFGFGNAGLADTPGGGAYVGDKVTAIRMPYHARLGHDDEDRSVPGSPSARSMASSCNMTLASRSVADEMDMMAGLSSRQEDLETMSNGSW